MVKLAHVRNGIYIGDGRDARKHGSDFEHVLTLSRNDGPHPEIGPHEHTTSYVPLYDGPRTDYEDFAEAVDTLLELIEKDGDVLVHCQAGVSRSATVLITALAEIDGIGFDEAYPIVKNARPQIAPHTALRELAYDYLGEDRSPNEGVFRDDNA